MIWLITVGLIIAIVIGVSIWIYSGEEDCEFVSVEQEEYEPDYPVKELLELIKLGEYKRVIIDYGFCYKFYFKGDNHYVQKRYLNFMGNRSSSSSISWLSEKETEWLYEQLSKHQKQQEESRLKQQREEDGEWIKQELRATDS